MSQVPPSAPPPAQPGYQPVPGKPAGLAIASMVLGILSACFVCIWWLSCILGILAIIFGAIAIGKVKSGEGGGGGMAKAGLILGIVGPAVSILLLILLIAGCREVGSQFEKELKRLEEEQRRQQQTMP